MKKYFLFIIICFLFFCQLLEAGEISLSMDEAVVLALRDNRDILLKKEDVENAKLKIAEAQASYFPTLTLTGGINNTRGYYPEDSTSLSNQATIKQYLYQGGKITSLVRYNEYNKAVSEALLDKEMLEGAFNVKKTFYALLLANDYVRLNKKIVNNSEQHYKYLGERYKKGEASESDLLRIRASLKSVKQAYVASLNQRESIQILLKNLLYLSHDVRIVPRGKLFYSPQEFLIYEVIFQKALKNRPEIRQYDFQARADKSYVDVAKAGGRPSVYASWDYYSKNTSSSLSGTPARGWNDHNIVGLTFTWPVFDGWLTKAKVEQAIVDLKTTQLLKEKTVADIVTEIKNAYISLKDAVFKIDVSRSDVLVYKDNLTVLREKWKQGIVSYLDIDDAELKYSIALFNQLQSIYDYAITRNQLDKARGEF